jgi:hypothetical protein
MLQKNSFLITIKRPRPLKKVGYQPGQNVNLELEEPNDNYIRYQKAEHHHFQIFFGERKPNNFNSYWNPINGTSIGFFHNGQNLEIRTDIGGTETVFYRNNKNSIKISNRLENVIEPEDTPNWSAIQCYLSFGFTLNDESFIREIKQTLSHQTISINTDNLELLNKQDDLPVPTNAKEEKAPYLSDILDIQKETTDDYGPMVLMMSAGWDSRTLLSTLNKKIHEAYTHGDLSSRETNLAKQLTGSFRINHCFFDINSMEISNHLLDEMNDYQGHCLWPIWHIAGRSIENRLGLPLTSGAVGARLGGHYGYLSLGSRYRRLLNSFNMIKSGLIPDHYILSNIKKGFEIPETFWFTSIYGQKTFDSFRDESNRKFKETLDAYRKKYQDLNYAIEQFNFDHRDRQYIAKQPQTAKSFSGYYSPLSHDKLLSVIYRTPFKYRFHNGMNKAIVQSTAPQLLEYPMAATLAKAKRSIFIQEISRIIRIMSEKMILATGYKKPSLGWFNYDHLYSGNLFSEIIDSLNSDVWSKEKMKTVISKNPAKGIDAGSTLDMLCKIKTVDHYLTLTEYRSTTRG